MRWKLILSGVLGLALIGPALADSGENLPDGPKGDGTESLPTGDETSIDEPEVDVALVLQGAIDDMRKAEQALAKGGSSRATDLEGRAIDELARLLDGGRENQDSAIQALELVIKSAKDGGGSGEKSSSAEKHPSTSGTSGTKKTGTAADSHYDPRGNHDDRPLLDRTIDPASRWGALPPNLRDEINQADDDFRSIRGDYRFRLFEYSKLLSQE